MTALSFVNPAYLSALALATIPILIHLIRRRRVRIIRWAAWDFLLQSTKRNRRRLRLEQLLLLLLRITLVVLVVLAFTRPLFRTLGLPLVAADARVHALIVLDNSYSMGYQRDGVRLFERAQKVAEELLQRVLKQGDSVSIVLLSSRPETLFRAPTFDLSRAAEKIHSARLSDRGTDFDSGAAFCAALLREIRTPTKEVYWITDSQKAGFARTGRERAREAWKELTEHGRVIWIDVSDGERANLSVEAPLFSRELVTPRAPVRIEATLRNFSPNEKRDLLVNLQVDGRTVGATRVLLPARGSTKASFVYLFEKSGVHTGSIRLGQPDALERDNTAYFAASVRDRLRVLVVNPRPASDPTRDEAFYLTTALSPDSASRGGSTAIQPVVHNGSKLDGLNLRDFDAVVVTGFREMGEKDRIVLEDYIRSGGGLLLFPAADTDPRSLNRQLTGRSVSSSPAEAFLPASYGARRELPEEAGVTLNPSTVNHPSLAPFRDTAEVNLSSARFRILYDLVLPRGEEGVRVLCRFSGGQPAFVERRFGQGKVIMAASTAGTSGNNLPYKPAYVPLIHQIVAYLAAGPTSQRNLRMDEPITARFEVGKAGRPVRLTDPEGQTRILTSSLTAEGVLVHYANTSRAGHYLLEIEEGGSLSRPEAGHVAAGAPNAGAYAVNLPAEEADLTAADEREIRTALGPVPIQFARASDSLTEVVGRNRRGVEIWRTLILIVLPLLFVEGLLAQRFGRRG